MAGPAVATWIAGGPSPRIEAPVAIAPRAWLLGVAAVQVQTSGSELVAQLRLHLTGADAPRIVPLQSPALIHAALLEPGAPAPVLPALAPPPLDGERAVFELLVGGALRARASLSPALAAASPPARAFGHVFCRWLREGGFEAGFDLTDFASQPPGVKFERIASEPLRVGEVVSYRLAWS